MGYILEAMEPLLEWAEQGGDEEYEFHMGEWAARPRYGAPAEDCGTTLCLAGKAAHSGGYKIVWGGRINARDKEVARHARPINPDGSTGFLQPIKEAGRNALGLSYAESEALFVPDLDGTDEDRKFAVAFLAHLTDRARDDLRNMSPTEVESWVEEWKEENE